MKLNEGREDKLPIKIEEKFFFFFERFLDSKNRKRRKEYEILKERKKERKKERERQRDRERERQRDRETDRERKTE